MEGTSVLLVSAENFVSFLDQEEQALLASQLEVTMNSVVTAVIVPGAKEVSPHITELKIDTVSALARSILNSTKEAKTIWPNLRVGLDKFISNRRLIEGATRMR